MRKLIFFALNLFSTTASAPAATNFLDTLSTMDTAHRGMPFIEGATKSTTDLQTMDYAFRGMPFVRYRK